MYGEKFYTVQIVCTCKRAIHLWQLAFLS